MKKLTIAALAVLSFAACSKKDDNKNQTTPTPTPTPTATSARFKIEFPAANLHIDTMKVAYITLAGDTIRNTLTGTNSWESPEYSYTSGKIAYASVTATGTVIMSGAYNRVLCLIRTTDSAVIATHGSNTNFGTEYSFSGEISNTF